MTRRISQVFYISFIAKLILAASIPLSLDEMYYWLWGQHPQLSYFDHPPMVGWLMILGDLFKPLADGAIRWPFVLISHLTVWIWYLILKPVVSEKHMLLWLWVALLNPLWGLGGVIATPDIPVILFWSLAFFMCHKIITNPSLLNYSLFGASLGLGFLSKYMIVIFPLCLIPWFYRDKLFPFLWNRKALATLLMGLLFCSPVLLWNYFNEFASLSFQWEHGTVAKSWKWFWSIDYLTSQVFLIFPLICWLLLRNRKLSHQFFYFSTIPLLFFFLTSFFSRVEANWPIIAYPAIYATAFLNIAGYEKYIKWLIGLWSSILALTIAFIIITPLGLGLEKKKLKLFEASKFEDVLEYSKDKKQVVANSYQMASYLSFRRNELICKIPEVEGRMDFFNYLPNCTNIQGTFHVITNDLSLESMKERFRGYSILSYEAINDRLAGYEVQKK